MHSKLSTTTQQNFFHKKVEEQEEEAVVGVEGLGEGGAEVEVVQIAHSTNLVMIIPR